MSKVLIVDDEEGVLRTLERLVKSREYTVFTAGCGADGLSIAEKEEPDVVLVDLLLDDMPGLAVMTQIKKVLPSAECIIVTGAGTKDSAISAVNLGAFGFVTKPWDDDQLLVMIKSGIKQSRTSRSLLESEEKLRNMTHDKVGN